MRSIGLSVMAMMAVALLAPSCKPAPETKVPVESDYAAARQQMVERLRKDRFHPITDERVLAAMGKVERHLFVDEGLRSRAYKETPLPIGEEQTISAPHVVALMSECAALRGGEKVLEVGTGSGYQAAILGELAAEVYTIEIVEPLGKRAEALLQHLGYGNVHVRIGDGFLGWPEEAPFDAVMITCSVPEFPHPLVEQLAEGGRIVAPVGETSQILRVGTKKGTSLETRDVELVVFVPMTGTGVEDMKKEAQKGR